MLPSLAKIIVTHSQFLMFSQNILICPVQTPFQRLQGLKRVNMTENDQKRWPFFYSLNNMYMACRVGLVGDDGYQQMSQRICQLVLLRCHPGNLKPSPASEAIMAVSSLSLVAGKKWVCTSLPEAHSVTSVRQPSTQYRICTTIALIVTNTILILK